MHSVMNRNKMNIILCKTKCWNTIVAKMCTFAFDLIILYGVQTAAYRRYNRQRITRQFL